MGTRGHGAVTHSSARLGYPENDSTSWTRTSRSRWLTSATEGSDERAGRGLRPRHRHGRADSARRLRRRDAGGSLGTSLDRGLTAAEAAQRLRARPQRAPGAGAAQPVADVLRPVHRLHDPAAARRRRRSRASSASSRTPIAILAIVVLNAVVGFVQEYRAEKRAARAEAAGGAQGARACATATSSRAGRRARARRHRAARGGQRRARPTCALIEAVQLRIEEAALTGESHAGREETSRRSPTPTRRSATASTWPTAGTIVTYGRGQGVVVATGDGDRARQDRDAARDDRGGDARRCRSGSRSSAAQLAVVALAHLRRRVRARRAARRVAGR